MLNDKPSIRIMETLNIKPSTPEATLAQCKNCNAEFSGKFCSACGQKYITERITVRRIFLELFASLTNLEKGFWYTFKMLFVNPGEVVRHFINGQTVRYYPPVRYLLLWITISVALSLMSGLYDQQQAAVQDLTSVAQEPEVAELQRKLQQQIQNEMKKYLTFLPLLMLPFMGWASFLVFRKREQNYAEHLVLNAYAYGQTTAMGIPLLLLTMAFPGLHPFLFLKIILLSIGYYAYLYRSFFQIRIGKAIFKGIFSTFLAYTFALLFFGIIGIVVGILVALKMKGG